AALGVHVARERDRNAVFHERCSLLALGRGDEVHGAELILFAPASPVRQLSLPLLVLGFAYGRPCSRRCKRLGAGAPASASSLACSLSLRLTCWSLVLALRMAQRDDDGRRDQKARRRCTGDTQHTASIPISADLRQSPENKTLLCAADLLAPVGSSQERYRV